jgi:hypothetical protein
MAWEDFIKYVSSYQLMAWEDFIKSMSAVNTKASNHVLILKVTIKEQLLMLNLVLSQSCC